VKHPRDFGATNLVYRAALLGISETIATRTWRSWLFGWVLRLVFQVAFFTLAGRLVGGGSVVRYILIGNVVAVVFIEAASVIFVTINERNYGTLPLLVSSPSNTVQVLLSRSLFGVVAGLVSALLTFSVVAPLFGISFRLLQLLIVVPLMLAIALSAYCFSSFVAALMMKVPAAPLLGMNVTYLSLMAFTGVNVPLDFWPLPVQWVANYLPGTHGLQAIRAVLSGDSTGWVEVLGGVGYELVIALAWLSTAAVLLNLFIGQDRRNGRIDWSG
jgi:ABC-2 type transport system permease protein